MKISGLSQQQVLESRRKHGPNSITEPQKNSFFRVFYNQLKSPLIYILLIAALASMLLGEVSDAVFILIVVLINTLLGFYQEYKAENTLEALQSRVSKTVKVVRKEGTLLVDATDLVPGDIIILEPGLRIPADGELLEANELLVNESILTGESEPVVKRLSRAKATEVNKIYMGSLVVQGLGKAVIKETGDDTRFGIIAKNLDANINPDTPIKIELVRLSRIITVFILSIIVFIIALGIVEGVDSREILLTSIALGVSTIPEGLVISLTVTLALGMNRIMQRNAIVKSLPAAETLGDIDVLCIDKTGTLTMGEMQVDDTEFSDKQLALYALAICNNDANFIDQAILEYLNFHTKENFAENVQKDRIQLFPFSSIQKYTGATDNKRLYATGAPEVILGFCTKNTNKKHWQEIIEEKSALGNRLIAVAYKELSKPQAEREDFKSMEFLGLVFVKDPVRKEAESSLLKIQDAGVSVKVITGDLKETTIKVLQTLNFDVHKDEMISGTELAEYTSQSKLQKLIPQIKLFYRTTPDQKLTIVKTLQELGKRVGMMGDGVNDSPAIKKAEIGISVDNATDVSKEVSDLILLDSNFHTIVGAIEEGRNIFRNLKKILTFLLADSLTETVLIISALVLKLPLPLTPLMLLWINIIEDGLPSLALSFEKPTANLLREKPRSPSSSILDRRVLSAIITVSLLKDVMFLILYKYLIDHNYGLEFSRTIVFAGIIISSLLFLFSAKTIGSTIIAERRNLFSNNMVNISVVIGVFAMFATIYYPPLQSALGTTSLTTIHLLILLGLSILNVIVVEIVKSIVNHKDKP